MSEFLELFNERQACRGFNDQPVEHDKLVACVQAAISAPSACNSQPWSFVVVEDANKVKQVAQCGQQNGMNPYINDAQAFVVVLEEHGVLMGSLRTSLDSQYFAKGDLGAAVAYLCLAAQAQGLGSLIIGLYDRPQLCEILDIPPYKQFAGLIAIGYSKDPHRPKQRKPLEEVTRFV
jgi:nitroreductase